MARSKRRGKKIKSKEEDRGVSLEEPDPDAEDFYYDDVDKFDANRQKIMLDHAGGDGEVSDGDSIEDTDEVMGLDISESDEDEHVTEESEDEEDVDSEDNATDKGLPDAKAWGKKKSAYYATDDVGPDVGSDEELMQLAEEEEQEALVLQKQMAAMLEDQDFDTADFEVVEVRDDDDEAPETGDDAQDKQTREKIIKDLTKLSREEKLEILIKDSPELLELLGEFKEKLTELVDKLQPLVQIARTGKILPDGANYLEVKHQLYLNYCINVGFYLLLKSRQTSVRHHPVIGRLVQYRALMKNLEPLDRQLAPQLQLLLQEGAVPASNGVQSSEKARKSKEIIKKRKKTTKLPELLDNGSDQETRGSSELEKLEKQKRKLDSGLVAELVDPLEYYESVKKSKKKKKEAKERLVAAADDLEVPDEETVDGKRQVTYEIFKNKGLTAKKKKELRNPRVKHRRKFHKASIKRKSQVRPVVNEQTRYGGETTGIRRNLTRSVRIN